MSDESLRIGGMVADLLGELEADYGDGSQVLDALIVVEIVPDVDEEDGVGSIIEHRSTTRRTTVALGMAELLCDSLRSGYERTENEDDESGDE